MAGVTFGFRCAAPLETTAENACEPNVDDNCQADANPDQQDFDIDGQGDVCDADDDNDGADDAADCAPTAPGIGALPGSIGTSLRIFGGAEAELSWTPGAQAPLSGIYRGTLDAQAFAYDHECIFEEIFIPSVLDATIPEANRSPKVVTRRFTAHTVGIRIVGGTLRSGEFTRQ